MGDFARVSIASLVTIWVASLSSVTHGVSERPCSATVAFRTVAISGISAISEAQLGILLTGPMRKVRALSPRMEALTAAGIRRSPTFAGVIAALADGDVIVQVMEVPHLPGSVLAQLVLVHAKSESRLVRVQIGRRRGGDDLIALLGHELFHALEIAGAPEVQDQDTLAAFYRRIGFATDREQQFDTRGAHDVERRIRRELGRTGCS